MARAMDDLDFPGWQPAKSVEVVEGNGLTQVLVKGQPYMRWQSGDEGCTRLAIVQLYKCGLGTEEDLAAAFGRHINSVQRYLRDFAGEGIQGLMTERRGPKGQWKLTPELRGKILHIVLREGIWKLEAIQQRLLEAWQEAVSVPSIQQVLEENGLDEANAGGVGGAVVQAELFAREPEPQLVLPLEDSAVPFREPVSTGSIAERQSGTVTNNAAGEEVGAADLDRGRQRNSYSSAQRVYLDRLEQGAYNAYAGGLLFAPLLARYQFIPTLSRVITTAAHEGYGLAELALTLFYLDVFGFRSLEDFKRAYPEEFGVLMGRTQSPSLFTLRRFLHQVRKLGQGEALIDEFARTYLQSGLAVWGVMYIDGHFMPYYGLYPISKGGHGVRQMPMKGSYNFLAVDERFVPVPDPLFVGGSAGKDTGADREGQTNRGASRSESAATGPIDRGVRSRGLQRGVVPLPGRQGSGSGPAAGAVRQLGQIFR
jgi:transposase